MKILVVEDDPGVAGFVAKGLKEAGYVTDVLATAEEALIALSGGTYDAAVVDIGLPGMDGLSLIVALRGRGSSLPILILSARHSVDDRVLGFKKGGDDYLVKPFSFAELLARLQALLRRSARSTAPASTNLACHDLVLDLLTHEVRRGGRRIDLQPREYSLLEYFMHNPGQVLTKTMILEKIWNYDFDPQTNVVDVLVHRLRAKLDKDFDARLIHTIRGVGYVLKAD